MTALDHRYQVSGNKQNRSTEGYSLHVEKDIDIISDICEENSQPIDPTNEAEVIDAVKRLNTGKAQDAYGITTENIIYACDTIYSLLSSVYYAIFRLHSVPDILKLGTVTPVFKKKGSKLEDKTYRGITVLPVLAKLLEILLRSRIRQVLDPQQNPLQRGFTAGSSPFSCSLIIEDLFGKLWIKDKLQLLPYWMQRRLLMQSITQACYVNSI